MSTPKNMIAKIAHIVNGRIGSIALMKVPNNNTEIKSCITNVVDIICFYKFNLYYIPNNLFFISF